MARRTSWREAARASGPVAPPSPAQAPRPLSQQYLRTGPTRPEGVATIMRQADTGYMWQLCDLLEHQRTVDCHLQTVCSRRERAVSMLPWQLLPASDRPRDLRVAAWVEDCIKAFGSERFDGLDLRGLADTITHLNCAPIHGYGVAEVPWRKDGRYVVPMGSLPMAPRRFIYAQMDASLRWFDVMGGPTENYYPGKNLLAEYAPGRFLQHRVRMNGAVGSREGLIRPLIWASVFRTWNIGDLSRLAELAWKPYRKGAYTDKAGKEDIADLEDAMRELTANGFTTFNKDRVDIIIEYAKNRMSGDGGLHIAFANFLGAEMSKVTLGATLTVEEGTRGTARTAGVHQDVSVEIRDGDARSEESTLQQQLVAPLVRYNFGAIPLPTFRFITEEGADMQALATAMDKMLNRGLDVPAKWLRAQLGIPEPDVGEELVGKGPRPDPNAPPPAAVPADEEGPAVSEKAMERKLAEYHLDRVLRAAGLRPANAQTRIAA